MKTAEITASAESIPAKRRQILAGARQVFGELGFERASVDLIATRAGVSKATVYNHFQDKKALFVASVVEGCEELRADLEKCLERPGSDLERSLRNVGEQMMAVFLSPDVANLYRHTIAEVARFPEVGRMVLERGTLPLQEAIARYLAHWRERGMLDIDDTRTAAIQFVALCQGDLSVRSRLGALEYPVDAQVKESVRRAVQTFVRAFRPGREGSGSR
ncbi:MAG TPA: TetR/AcrR family transcriptional regulator [Anaeromyxobacter sp.]|nr:TetR/AcrR family transcriptional regulator [Anaeromyxobacter sp.]